MEYNTRLRVDSSEKKTNRVSKHEREKKRIKVSYVFADASTITRLCGLWWTQVGGVINPVIAIIIITLIAYKKKELDTDSQKRKKKQRNLQEQSPKTLKMSVKMNRINEVTK